MKSLAKKSFGGIWLAVFTVILCSSSITAKSYSANSHYVVLGAFSIERNAIKFTNFVKGQDMSAKFALHEQRALYYVYTMNTENLEAAVTLTKEVQQTKTFWDAWVFTGQLKHMQIDGPQPVVVESEINQGDISESSSEDTNLQEEVDDSAEDNNQPADDVSSLDGESSDNIDATSEDTAESEAETGATAASPQLIVNTSKGETRALRVYANAYNASNYKEVKGNLEVIDLERTKRIALEKTHQSILVMDPNNGSGRFQLFANIFGFKTMQHDLNFENLYAGDTLDIVEVSGDSLIVDFELFRYDVGETEIMYNVFFYKDAAVIKPESQYELNQLLGMLMENPSLRVKMHGHTNGNSMGKIIYPLASEGDFFKMGDENKVGKGSSKKLSHERANSIKQYLIAKGVGAERMEIEGWGGKRMLYDKHENKARFNVRVEVEILAK